MTDVKAESGWVKLYAKSGALVTIPVTDRPLNYAAMAANVDAMIAAGFLVTAPGLEEGEEKDEVGYVVHGIQDGGRDREQTPFLLLYSSNDAQKFSFLKVYLNTKADIEAFEYAAKVKLSSIPVYIGQDKPERGKNRNVDQFIVPMKKPFMVVFSQNQKYSEADSAAAKAKGEVYSVPRRKFVRWAEQKPNAEQQTNTTTTVPNTMPIAANPALFGQMLKFMQNARDAEELGPHWSSFLIMKEMFTPAQIAEGTQLHQSLVAKFAAEAAKAKPPTERLAACRTWLAANIDKFTAADFAEKVKFLDEKFAEFAVYTPGTLEQCLEAKLPDTARVGELLPAELATAKAAVTDFASKLVAKGGAA